MNNLDLYYAILCIPKYNVIKKIIVKKNIGNINEYIDIESGNKYFLELDLISNGYDVKGATRIVKLFYLNSIKDYEFESKEEKKQVKNIINDYQKVIKKRNKITFN